MRMGNTASIYLSFSVAQLPACFWALGILQGRGLRGDKTLHGLRRGVR